jgi:hypothetical protein
VGKGWRRRGEHLHADPSRSSRHVAHLGKVGRGFVKVLRQQQRLVDARAAGGGGASPRSAAARSVARVFVRRDCIRSFARVRALSTEPALPKLGFMRSRAMMATASSAVGSVIERPAERTCGGGVGAPW